MEKCLVQKILIQIQAPGEMESEREEDFGIVGTLMEPYRLEPVAPLGYEEPEEKEDKDGLTPAILEARSDNQITLDIW